MASPGVMYAAVAVGSALGAILRHLVNGTVVAVGPTAFPLATLIVNVVGSFLIGLVATASGPGGRWPLGPASRQFLMVGVFGGLTTFSIFSLETLALVEGGRGIAAGLNLGLSLLLWIPSAWAGHLLARRLNEPRGRG